MEEALESIIDDYFIHNKNSIFGNPGDYPYNPFSCFCKVVIAVSRLYMECSDQSLFRRVLLDIYRSYSANYPFNRNIIRKNHLSKLSLQNLLYLHFNI